MIVATIGHYTVFNDEQNPHHIESYKSLALTKCKKFKWDHISLDLLQYKTKTKYDQEQKTTDLQAPWFLWLKVHYYRLRIQFSVLIF